MIMSVSYSSEVLSLVYNMVLTFSYVYRHIYAFIHNRCLPKLLISFFFNWKEISFLSSLLRILGTLFHVTLMAT